MALPQEAIRVIYFTGVVWLIVLGICISMAHDAKTGWLGVLIFAPFVLIMTAVFLDILRFSLPVEWRIRWPKWDAFLCRCGSHRCIRICGSGCCWECIRCNPDDPNVKRRLELLGRTR